jgi:hypothetical protein
VSEGQNKDTPVLNRGIKGMFESPYSVYSLISMSDYQYIKEKLT